MIDAPACPVCEARDWETLGQRTWKQSDLPALSPVIQRRLRVLYEVWQPGTTEFTARSELCRQCGFVIYSPRPTAGEIDAKYRFLTDLGPDTALVSIDSEYNRIRVANLFRVFGPSLPKSSGNQILDFGGGDGRLLQKFIDRGDQCFAVDYVRETVPGVTKISDTLDGLPAHIKFDGIIASHVLEHVADPVGVLRRLISHLEQRGRIYIELPMEIWRKPPLHEEPVTHVNFFTDASTQYMLHRVGLRPLLCHTVGLTLPGVKSAVIRAIGELSPTPLPPPTHGAATVRELLQPGLISQIRRACMHPEALTRGLSGRFKRLFGK